VEAGNDPKQGTKHGSHHPAEPEPTATTYATAGAPSVTPGEQPFVRQTVAGCEQLRQRGTASATIGNRTPNSTREGTWRKEAVDSRTYTPWSERPTLQKFLDIPYELKRMVVEAFTPMPLCDLGELKARAHQLLQLSEPEISRIANKDLVNLISAASERLGQKPQKGIQDLINEFDTNRGKNREDLLQVRLKQTGEILAVDIVTNSYTRRSFRAPDSELSRLKTRELIATVIKVAEMLAQLESGAGTLKFAVGSQNPSSLGHDPHLWEVYYDDFYRVGFKFQPGLSIMVPVRPNNAYR
jgi:hypothetical protein